MLPSATTPHPKVSKGLWHKMRYGLEEGEQTSVIVLLRSRDRPALRRRLAAPELPGEEKAVIQQRATRDVQDQVAMVVDKHVAAKPRGVPRLPRGKDRGDPTRSWLVNALVTVADRKLVGELTGRDDVQAIVENLEVNGPEPIRTASSQVVATPGGTGATWALEHLQISKLWKEGYRGQDIRIGHVDTGVDKTHPDLLGKVVAFGAFDQFGNMLAGVETFDSAMHGTHTAGTLVGGDESGIAIGVAPEAKLVSGQGIPYGRGTLAQVILATQWAVEHGVRVLNMSIGGIGYNMAYEIVLPGLIRNNVFPVISIGNEGFGVTGSPGNMQEACGVGASTTDDEVPDFSGGGSFDFFDDRDKPVRFIKPDMVAPGVSILSSIPAAYGRSYEYFDGTSMAAPHVAGVVALLRQARPDLPVAKVKEALEKTCHHPLGKKRPAHDNRYGRGIIQPLAALNRLLAMPH